MITIKGLPNYDIKTPTVVTIGTFDGVHIGHRIILKRLIADARSQGMQATLLTFFPHPRMVLQKDSNLKLLNTIEEKSDILREIGLDCLVIHPFTQSFSRLTATQFVRDKLVGILHAKKVIIGYDHRFGRNRNANIQDLQAFGNLLDFSVEEIPAQEIDEVSVSSTKIRKALETGDLQTANEYLGYSYMLSGKVVRGKGLGKQLDFPTANLEISAEYKLIPAGGVYLVSAQIDEKTVYGMMNIGSNPTVNGSGQNIEIHFFDFDKNLYDQPLRVFLLERLRDEKKFESVEALRAQLQKDRLQSMELIAKR